MQIALANSERSLFSLHECEHLRRAMPTLEPCCAMCHSQDVLQSVRVSGAAARVCCSVVWALLRGAEGEILVDDDGPNLDLIDGPSAR
jgi:hypothetical protein